MFREFTRLFAALTNRLWTNSQCSSQRERIAYDVRREFPISIVKIFVTVPVFRILVKISVKSRPDLRLF